MTKRILHISNHDYGGAGMAAMRLHLAMLEDGLDSKFLCLEKTTNSPNVVVYPKFYLRFYHRILERFGLYLTHSQKNQRNLEKIKSKIQPQMFSFLHSDYRIDEHPLVDWADVIIIHWVSGFLDFKTFFGNLNKSKKVFWYTHDFYLILGGFHTLFDSKRFNEESIADIEDQLKVDKRSYLSQFPALQIIANSKFTFRTISEQEIFKSTNLHCIPLGLPENELKPIKKSIAKQALGFTQDDFILLTVSADLSLPLKGMDRLEAVLSNVDAQSETINVITLGSDPLDLTIPSVEFHHMGSVWQSNFKSIVFSAADLVISTSYEETFGQTIIEGYACCTPAIVFNNGGLPELVEHGKTGFVAVDILDFSKYIEEIRRNSKAIDEMGQNAFNLYKKSYTSKNQLTAFRAIFKS